MDIFVLLWGNFGVPEQFGCLGPLAWPGICVRAMYNSSDSFNKRRNSLSRIERKVRTYKALMQCDG